MHDHIHPSQGVCLCASCVMGRAETELLRQVFLMRLEASKYIAGHIGRESPRRGEPQIKTPGAATPSVQVSGSEQASQKEAS
jgi:hypothetical protein